MSDLQMLLCIKFAWCCWIQMFKAKESERAIERAALGRAGPVPKCPVDLLVGRDRQTQQ